MENISVWTPDQVVADAEQSDEWDEESLAKLKALFEALGPNTKTLVVHVQEGEKTTHD